MYGWTGKYLHVDLSAGKINVRQTDGELSHKFLGGRGLSVALIKEFASLEPFDENMPLIFAVGPMTNAPVPTAGRSSLVSRSPLTGAINDSNVGGNLGHHIKAAGYDYLFVTGVSEKPVYLSIEDDRAELVECHELWGKSVVETGEALTQKKKSLVSIGPAGENKVLFAAAILDSHYAFGRGGIGAVMGHKKLKAILVGGTGKMEVHDPELLKESSKDIMRLLRAAPIVYGEHGLREVGTTALLDLLHVRRMMPTANFSKTYFVDEPKISTAKVRDKKYDVRKYGCYGCPILCKKKDRAGTVMPEFETTSHFGALLENTDYESIVEANELCNDLGLDTISAAVTLSCYGEIEGHFSNPDEIKNLLQSISRREGVGDELAEGSYRYAESHGKAGLSMSVKKMELPAYDPRGAYGMALAFGTSCRGGCHLRAYPISHEILRKPVATDRFSFTGKARIIKIAEDANAAVDSLVVCKFPFFAASHEEYSKALTAVTGEKFDAHDLNVVGERTVLLERHINCLNGFRRKDDMLPERFYTEEGSSGDNIEIAPIDRNDYEQALTRYYHTRGCDDDGVPLPEKLNELGIE
jgi:aldehyde:ferredoxin oxidoreductase